VKTLVSLKKGSPPRAAVTLSHSLPIACALSLSCSSVPLRAPLLYAHAVVVVMASLGHPDRFQSEAALNLVRGLLGWSAPGLAGRIRAGAAPCWNLLSAAKRPTRVNSGDNRVTCSGAIALLI
jgi:hypothetical protein